MPLRHDSDTSSGADVVPLRQERLVIPLNRIMGRNQLEQPSSSLPVYGPGEGGDALFVVPTLDYFDRLASREHCMIELDEDGEVRVRDLGSTYGTFLQRHEKMSADQWLGLSPGVSYVLVPGQRLRLGQDSVVEYEYTGISSDIHIRLRYWSRDISFPLESSPFEWTAISADGGSWSSASVLGETGPTLHDAPHLTVRCELRGKVPVATVELEATEVSPSTRTVQVSGSSMHGADLDTSGEPDVVHHFRAGYELLLPGPSRKETGMGMIAHTFLQPSHLRFHAVLDARNWLSFVSVGYAHVHTPNNYRTGVEFKGDGSYDTTALAELEYAAVDEIRREDGIKVPSLSKAIVVALIERRRLDRTQGGAQEAGWVTREHVVELRGQEVSEDQFQNNFTKWRSELAKKLKISAAAFRQTRAKSFAIPEEADWIKFAESKVVDDRMFIRLSPTIEVQFLRG